MMLRKVIAVLNLLILVLGSSCNAFYIDRTDKTPCNKKRYVDEAIPVHSYFSVEKKPVKQSVISTDPLLLQQVARDALQFFDRYKDILQPVLAPKHISKHFISAKLVYETLSYIDQIIEQDKKNGTPFRIQDPDFIHSNFGFLRWYGDRAISAQTTTPKLEDGTIKLTHYVIYNFPGSYVKTKKYCYPLYRLKEQMKRLPYTKQEILGGLLSHGPLADEVDVLVWVTRETLEEAMLQGTGIITMPDGVQRAFNVDLSNGYSFERGVKLHDQKIYWFFREILKKERVDELIEKSHKRKGVLFAGDLYHIGFGKIIGLSFIHKKTGKPTMQLGVIGDSGGAFLKNMHQLDFFGGIFASKKKLQDHLGSYPSNVGAHILYKRPKAVKALHYF